MSFLKDSPTLLLGAHTSAAGGAPNALIEGRSIGATTIQLFTSNQKQWKGREIEEEEIALFKKLRAEYGFSSLMSHDSYLINLGSPDPLLLEKSRQAFTDELKRCHLLSIDYLNFHPGAFTTGSKEQCLDTIIESLLQIAPLTDGGPTKVVLETTAGQGSSVGYRFEEIGYIIKNVKNALPVGVCIDTCHIFSAGYDIRTFQGWEETLVEFDKHIGLEFLSAFHLNDSKQPFGARKDRHANLGEGLIGLECFQFVMKDPRLASLPKYLETPGGPPTWTKEIELLKTFAQG